MVEWSPLPPREGQAFSAQDLAFHSPADVLFYGGAAGGGKTDLLIGLALKAHKRSIIFRREYPELEAIEDRCKELIGDLGSYNSQKKIWRVYDGRRLEFGAVQYLDDVRKFQGRPHDLIGFDEITRFLRPQFDFLQGWLRTTDPRQRTRIVCTGNPPTDAEGYWVIEYWAPWLDENHPQPAKAGELRWYAVLDEKEVEVPDGTAFSHKGETIQPKSRTFIPARVEDNPYYWNTGYVTTLQNLPEPLRSQLLKGDFAIGQKDDPWQVIPTAWIEAAMARWTDKKPDIPMSALGVDVARGGNDQTTLAPRYGNWFDRVRRHPGSSTPDGPAVAALVKGELRDGTRVNVDVIGVGASVYDALRANGIDVVGLNGAEASSALDRTGQLSFRNKRSEWYWKFREALDPQYGENIALPPDRELKADLTTAHWKLTISGIQVESKEEIKKRIGRSPDVGDSVLYAAAIQHDPGIIAFYRALAEEQKRKQEQGAAA